MLTVVSKIIRDHCKQRLTFLTVFFFQKETPSSIQLHLAALRGDLVALKRVLDSGKVHVDCRDEVSNYKLIYNSFLIIFIA